jgi:endoglucanase
MKKLSFLLFLTAVLFSGCKKHTAAPVCQPFVNTANFRGVNWADERDNYVDGPLVLSGFTGSDNYAAIQAKANIVMSGFKNNMGANTVRMPINPQTVNQSWWNSYTGAIDGALANHMKVILACWEGVAHKDGMIDDTAQFYAMWHCVINKYGGNDSVYFEIFNEPFGYTAPQWQTICQQWLDTFSSVPHCHVLIGGTGYDDNVTPMGADSIFNDCLLSQHGYAFWVPTLTYPQDWETLLQSRVSPWQNRTIVTEFGAPMTTGIDYAQSANGNSNIAFMQGVTIQFAAYNMGSCYWPGLRDSDTYSMQILQNDSMITTNASGLALVKNGWGVH